MYTSEKDCCPISNRFVWLIRLVVCALIVATLAATTSVSLADDSRKQTVNIRVGGGSVVPPGTLEKTRLVMLARARSLGLRGSTAVAKSSTLCVTVPGKSPIPPAEFAAIAGNVAIQILPHGAKYITSGTPIASVHAGNDQIGQYVVSLRMTDPTAFGRFTAAHLNREVGIFIDERLISSVKIVTPVEGNVEIAGVGVDDVKWLLLAAVVSSGPLPAAVSVVGSECK